MEKVNDTLLPKKVTQRDRRMSQQTQTLVTNRVTSRNKYRNYRNQDSYDNWGEEATELNQSSKVYSIIRYVSGKLTTSTVKLINE